MTGTETTNPEEMQLLDTETLLSETTATSFVEDSTFGSEHNELNEIDINPSGLRPVEVASIATETSYATSAGSQGRVHVPFKCLYCHKLDSVPNTHAWMKHFYRDLQSYIYTFEGRGSSKET